VRVEGRCEALKMARCGGRTERSEPKVVRVPNMIRQSILRTGREMPTRMVGLLDTLFQSQNIYLIDLYCFRKVVPKVDRWWC